jgi:hypothetical protein
MNYVIREIISNLDFDEFEQIEKFDVLKDEEKENIIGDFDKFRKSIIENIEYLKGIV